VYEGEWEGGEKNGVGTFQCPDFTYDGVWRAGKK
jgi:hypothetical protein